jgi:glycosyltransferase involved in cell wall biosynthesis
MRFVIAGSNGISVTSPGLRRRLALLMSDESSNVVVDDRRVAFEDAQVYLALADVVVLPYREGSTSGVLKLAMAFRKPVLATNVGDIPETMEEIHNGIVVPCEDNVPHLVEGLRRIRDDWQSFKSRCESVPEKYKWETIARQYHDFLVAD